MREVIYRFVQSYYTEILAVLPVTLLMIGLLIAVMFDSYTQKWQRSF